MNKTKAQFKSPLIAFSAPSGAGKTTIVKALAQKYPEIVISISATTRPIRPDEKHGRDYYFMDRKSFEKSVSEGAFLEYEQVHDNYYGTLLNSVQNSLNQGRIVLFDIDVNGALSIKKYFPHAQLIFIMPPSEEELINRLRKRKSETDESIKKRLERLKYEYDMAGKFDHIVINDNLQEAIQEVESLLIWPPETDDA